MNTETMEVISEAAEILATRVLAGTTPEDWKNGGIAVDVKMNIPPKMVDVLVDNGANTDALISDLINIVLGYFMTYGILSMAKDLLNESRNGSVM